MKKNKIDKKRIEQLIQVTHLLEEYEKHLNFLRKYLSKKTYDDVKKRLEEANKQILKILDEIEGR